NAIRVEREAQDPLVLGAGGIDGDVLLLADAAMAGQLARRHAVATGVYEPADELLLRSKSYAGSAGWHVLTPLRLEDGSRLLVDRGWVPYELDEAPVAVAAPPQGTVTVSGFLQASQTPPSGAGASFAPRDP